MASGNPFAGVCQRTDSFPPGAHSCPRPWLDPLGVPRQKSKPPANKEPLTLVCCGWALAQRVSTRGLTYRIFIGLWESPSRAQHRPLSLLRALTAAARTLTLTESPVSGWMEPAQGLLNPEQLFYSLESAVVLLKKILFPSFQTRLETH